MSLYKMDSCLVDVQFLQNEDKLIFAKRVVVVGITKSFDAVCEDIVFPYPTTKEFITEDEENSLKTFGHLELSRKEKLLIKALNKFKAIIVPNQTKHDFIASFIDSSKHIVIVSKK